MSQTESPALQPLQAPRSLAEDAADRIREQILAGGFRQGEHLVEARIAEQLNVSRGPVREALKLLRAEGLVEEEPRRGTFVARLDGADVREIYQVRAAVEGQAAKILASSRPAAELEEMRSFAAAIDRAIAAGDVAEVSRADLAFHEALCRLSGNARLAEVFNRYVPVLRGLLRLDERVYCVARRDRPPAPSAPGRDRAGRRDPGLPAVRGALGAGGRPDRRLHRVVAHPALGPRDEHRQELSALPFGRVHPQARPRDGDEVLVVLDVQQPPPGPEQRARVDDAARLPGSRASVALDRDRLGIGPRDGVSASRSRDRRPGRAS